MAAASPPRGYRPQGRWAERAEMGPIKTLPESDPPYFTPLKGDAELGPGSLDRLLAEAEASPSGLGEDFQLSELFPGEESDGEGESLDTTRTSPEEPCGLVLSSLERPMELPWRPTAPEETPRPRDQPEDEDSPGSAGEVEEPEENPLQSSSLPQTPEQEKFLKQHFETLTDAAEKFEGSLKDLKPPEPGEDEKNLFLNPRLSISARFLWRCQKSRLVATVPLRAPARPQSPACTQEPLRDEPQTPEELQQPENPPGEKPQETDEETGSDSPTGSRRRVEAFTAALGVLRGHFQETLGLYNQVTPCAKATAEDVAGARTALAGLLGWMKAELRARAVTPHANAATEAPALPLHPETLRLLRAYSDSLLEMVRRSLEGGSPEML